MKPSFFTYKSIDVSWFLAFAMGLIIISSFIVRSMANEYGEDVEKIEDIFFILIIGSFIGSRLFYVLLNFDLYKDNLLSIFKLSYYNLSLLGGVASGVMTLKVLSKIYKIDFQKLLGIYVLPYYFSMAIGIWIVLFDKFLVSFSISKNPIKVFYISMIFLLAMILEVVGYSIKSKNIRLIILTGTMILYYLA